MGLSRTISEIDGNFCRKSQKFSHPFVFCAPAEGVPRGIGYRRRGQKTRMMGLPGRQISLTISSVIWIECTNVTDRQTDVQLQTDTGPQQRPRLRIASRGKKKSTDFNNFWYTTYFRTHDDYHFVYTSPVKCCRVLVSAKSDFSTIFNVSPDYAQQVLKMTWLFDSRSSTLGSEMD